MRPTPVGRWEETGWSTGGVVGGGTLVWVGVGAGLVPPAAGSGGVGVRVLQVDAPMSRCVCRVLGVCFWHLFCCSKEKK